MDERGVIVSFLKPEVEISELLERIGIRNYAEKKLWPTCYAYSMKDGSHHIAHFKELLRNPSMDNLDEKRRNSILRILYLWEMIDISDDIRNEIFENRWSKRLCILEVKQIEEESWEIIHKIHENTLHYHRTKA